MLTAIDVRRAFQALALDEHREAFSPTLWHLPEQKVVTKKDVTKQRDRVEELRVKYYATLDRPETSKDIRQEACRAWQQAKTQLTMLHEQSQPPSELKQVWFPGVHINAGGGSSDTLEGKGDLEGMLASEAVQTQSTDLYCRNFQHHFCLAS